MGRRPAPAAACPRLLRPPPPQLLPAVSRKPPQLHLHGHERLWGWLQPVFRVSDEELVRSAGLDALIGVRIISFGVLLFLPMTILGVAVLLPINYTSDYYKQMAAQVSAGAGAVRAGGWLLVPWGWLSGGWWCACCVSRRVSRHMCAMPTHPPTHPPASRRVWMAPWMSTRLPSCA